MADADQINAYLTATRGSASLTGPPRDTPERTKAANELADYYSELHQGLAIILAHSLYMENPWTTPLTVVYSALGHAETITLDTVHLVYDQYLGQIFNSLNRFYYEERDYHRLRLNGYLHKLCASRALAAGRPGRALEHANIYAVVQSVLAKKSASGGAATASHSRAVTTSLVEGFVVAHELMHCVYSTHPEVATAAESFCVDLVASSDRESVHEAAVTFMTRRHDAYAVAPARPALPEALGFDFDVMGPTFGVASDDVSLREECVCDGFAILATGLWARTQGIGSSEAVKAAFIGLHHLRLLSHIDSLVTKDDTPQQESPQRGLRLLGETQYRMSFFRSMEWAWRQLGIWPAVDGEADNLIDVNESYWDVIFDYALDDFDGQSENQREIARDKLDKHPVPLKNQRDEVRRLCGLP